MVWQVLQHLVSLRRLGFDTWYVEDSDRPLAEYHRPYGQGPANYDDSWDFTGNLDLLAYYMRAIGFADRWVFRTPEVYDACHGATDIVGLAKLYREADAVLNLCGSQELRDEHRAIRCLIYLETDPVKNQVAVAQGDPAKIEELDAYHYRFTYGTNLGAPECTVPVERHRWIATRPPVCPEWWTPEGPPAAGTALTTIANWRHKGKDVVWNGEVWRWSKHHEFQRFINLPSRARLPLEMAIGAIRPDEWAELQQRGWRTVRSHTLEDPAVYRDYVRTSLGEFTVAKEQYTRPRTGWFSDRSVCYLAAGRPVVTQDTGFGRSVPTGEGLFAYATEDEALAAIAAIADDYPKHSAAAGEIAREYFDGVRVLGELLNEVGLMARPQTA